MAGEVIETNCKICGDVIHIPCAHATLIGGGDEWYLEYECTSCRAWNIKELLSSTFILWLHESGMPFLSWDRFRESIDAPLKPEFVEKCIQTLNERDEFYYSMKNELGIE